MAEPIQPLATETAPAAAATTRDEQEPWDKHIPVFFNYLIVSVMMVCVAGTLIALLQSMLPKWNGTYVLVVCFLVSLETLYTTRATRRVPVPSREWLTFRATELISLLIILKLLIYAMRGFDRLLADLQLWQQDFLPAFFTGEYLGVSLIAMTTWLLCHQFNSDLIELEADDETLERERRNDFRNDRQAIRKQLSLKVVLIGAALVAMSVLTRSYLRVQGGEAAAARIGIGYLLLYIVLGFLLLSLTRLAALRASWFRERATIATDVGRRWLGFSLLLVIGLAVVASVLPTHYTVGLLDMLRYGIGLIGLLIQIIFYLVLLIITLPLNFLMSLLGKGPVMPNPPQAPPRPPPAPAQSPTTADPLLDLLQSAVFWAIFVLIVGYSLLHYLRRHGDALAVLRRIPILGWLARGAEWLWNALRQWQGQFAAAVDAGLRWLRPPPLPPEPTERPRGLNLRRLSPRERVQYFYLAMVRRAGQHGVPRRPAQTPREYASALESAVPEVNAEIDSLTESFIEARYSRHDITPDHAGRVQSYWNRIRSALRARLSR